MAQIAQRVEDRFRLLTGGSRVALPRHQTLEALLEWSYELLDADEQALLGRLAVFVGGWTLEAAEAVCTDASVPDVLAGLTGLIDKSLVQVEPAGEGLRYRLLENGAPVCAAQASRQRGRGAGAPAACAALSGAGPPGPALGSKACGSSPAAGARSATTCARP